MASNYVKSYQRQQQQAQAGRNSEIKKLEQQKIQNQANFDASKPDQASNSAFLYGASTSQRRERQRQDQMKQQEFDSKQAGIDAQIKSLQNPELSAKEKGIQTGLEILGPDGLERMGADRDVQEVLRRKKKIADEGISSAEREQMRARMAQQMGQAQQMAGFQLGGALGGAKGAGVAAQQRSLAAQGLAARANIESDIFMAQESAKRQGLESYSSSLGEVKTFDIGQAAKERDIMFQSIMGYEQMASSERAAQMQADAAAKRGGGCHIAGTKVLMADHSYKNIEDIKIGDEVMLGGKVEGTGTVLTKELMYTLNGEVFTQSHLIFDPKSETYQRADESVHASLYTGANHDVVYPIYTENRCYVTSFVSGDFGMEENYREVREDMTYRMKGINYGK